MKKEVQIKAHTRKTKSGKTVTVKAHSASRDSADSMAKEALKKKKGSGKELQKSKERKDDFEKYSDSDLDMYPKSDIKKVAKALGISNIEAASWAVGPNFKNYKESHLNKGERAAKKYLGQKLFSQLDPSSSDSYLAVLNKVNKKNTTNKKTGAKKTSDNKKSSLSSNDIIKNNKYVQKYLAKGWKVLKPLKGHDEVVLAAPKGYKVRAFKNSGSGDYVWGGINKRGSYDKYNSKYNARAYYEDQAKELNGVKNKRYIKK